MITLIKITDCRARTPNKLHELIHISLNGYWPSQCKKETLKKLVFRCIWFHPNLQLIESIINSFSKSVVVGKVGGDMTAVNHPHLTPRPYLRDILYHFIVLRSSDVQVWFSDHHDGSVRTRNCRIVLEIRELVYKEAHVQCRHPIRRAITGTTQTVGKGG